MPLLSEQLRKATAALHAEMEGLPFFQALADGSLPLDSYISQLRAFAVIFASLERSAAAVEDDSVREMCRVLEGRFSLLLRDLEVFSELLMPDIAAAVQRSLDLAHGIRLLAAENPRILVGHLYALGGTILGNLVHLEDVRRILPKGGKGAAFYAGFAERTGGMWQAMSSLMDRFSADEVEQQLIARTAQETFRALIATHAALYPLPPPGGRKLTATALNPEAGSHPIPDDLREVRAALAAGRRCRAEFPYLDARYGERGKRFTSSDVAWLATLPRLETAGVVQQVNWLADLMARLGLPRILLERQLALLLEELSAQVPERRELYGRLEAGVETLKRARLAQLSQGEFDELSERVESALAPRAPGVANLGVLIVSSLTDEACGIEESARALEAWLTDSGNFPSGGAAAVREAFGEIRDTLTRHAGGRPHTN